LNLEDGKNRLSRNVGTELPLCAAKKFQSNAGIIRIIVLNDGKYLEIKTGVNIGARLYCPHCEVIVPSARFIFEAATALKSSRRWHLDIMSDAFALYRSKYKDCTINSLTYLFTYLLHGAESFLRS
jgi:hypothetical protein